MDKYGNINDSNKEFIEKIGTVREALPDAKFSIELDEEEKLVVGYISGKMRKARIKVMPGDKVKIQFSPYDENTGRIVFRMKNI